MHRKVKTKIFMADGLLKKRGRPTTKEVDEKRKRHLGISPEHSILHGKQAQRAVNSIVTQSAASKRSMLPLETFNRMQEKINGELDELLDVLISNAKSGDTSALIYLLNRRMPPDSPIYFKIGKIITLEDAYKALGEVSEGLGNGQLTPSEAKALRDNLLAFLSASQLAEVSRKIDAIEKQIENPGVLVGAVSTNLSAKPQSNETPLPPESWWEKQKTLRDERLKNT